MNQIRSDLPVPQGNINYKICIDAHAHLGLCPVCTQRHKYSELSLKPTCNFSVEHPYFMVCPVFEVPILLRRVKLFDSSQIYYSAYVKYEERNIVSEHVLWITDHETGNPVFAFGQFKGIWYYLTI